MNNTVSDKDVQVHRDWLMAQMEREIGRLTNGTPEMRAWLLAKAYAQISFDSLVVFGLERGSTQKTPPNDTSSPSGKDTA